ncbi:MAG: glycoside hydrolase family 127 protein, partial [Chloroflexi bacterium]|nr:glycoside hydrolase family 127 protein [Chloroflexota bacterium]
YVNPLTSNGDHQREPWYSCACCPPNIARLLASVGNYFYSQTHSQTSEVSKTSEVLSVWIHLYAQSEARFENGLMIKQTTNYPHDGLITITMTPPTPARFKIHLRRPAWCESFVASVNGIVETSEVAHTAKTLEVLSGYIVIDREWQAGDTITLNFEMPIRFVYANPNARQMIGRVALQRGPVVYCVEGVDHDGLDVSRLVIKENGWEAEHRTTVLGGVTVLKGKGGAISPNGWGDDLYRFASPRIDPITITAVPYSVWGNRGAGSMRVWLQRSYG